jgi:formyltetrahydrofolate synthetase
MASKTKLRTSLDMISSDSTFCLARGDTFSGSSADIKLMPGTASEPAFRNIDVDVSTGRVKGLF